MALETKDRLREDLKRGQLAPVYVLFGSEVFLRDLAVRTITEKAFSATDLRDFNEATFDLGSGVDLKDALAVAYQIPMMSGKRVIKITDVRISASGYRDTIKETDEPALSAYFSAPSEHAVVIFVVDELNGVRKMGKLLREQAYSVNFEPLGDDELLAWARRTFKDEGATVDEIVVRSLVGRVGPNLEQLTNEIKKLVTAALPDGVVTVDLVEALVANTREVSNFLFTDQLITGRKAEALSTLAKTLDDGVEPLVLLGSISYAYRRLLMAKDMMQRGVDRKEVARVVKLRYNDQEPFLAAARRADSKKLREAMGQIAETDLAIKTSAGGGGPAAARTQLEILACKLAMV